MDLPSGELKWSGREQAGAAPIDGGEVSYWHTDGEVWYLYNTKPPLSETIFAGINPRNEKQAVVVYAGINAPAYVVRLGVAHGQPYIRGYHDSIVSVGYRGSTRVSLFDLSTGRVLHNPTT